MWARRIDDLSTRLTAEELASGMAAPSPARTPPPSEIGRGLRNDEERIANAEAEGLDASQAGAPAPQTPPGLDPAQLAAMERRRVRDMAVAWDKLQRRLWGDAKRVIQRLHDERERSHPKGFTRVCDAAELEALGEVEEEDEDRPLGLTLGWTKQAVNMAVAAAEEYLFDSGPFPCEYTSRGESEEGPWKERALQLFAEAKRDAINYRAQVRAFLRAWATYPVAVARTRWVERVEMALEDGRLVERVAYRGPDLRVWDPRWVWFSDPDRPTVDEQRLVVWYSEPSVAEILAEEMVIAVDAEGGETRRGRFICLEALRREREESVNGGRGVESYLGNLVVPAIRRQKAERHPEPRRGLFELHGYFDAAQLIFDGDLDPLLLSYLEILDVSPEDDPRELARRLSGVFWRIAFTADGKLIEFGIADAPDHEALVACYEPGEGLYGQGCYQLGGHLARAVDKLMNAEIWTQIRNADPTAAVSQDVQKTNNGGEELTPADVGKVISGRGGDRVLYFNAEDMEKAIRFLTLPGNPNYVQTLQAFADEYGKLTRITPNIKGQGDDNTASQANQNLARSSLAVNKGSEIVGRGLIEPWEVRLWEGVERRMTVEEFQRELLRIAGRAGIKAIYYTPTLDHLADQIDITHTGKPYNDRIIRTEQLRGIAELFIPLGTMDAEEAQSELLISAREMNPERFLTSKGKSLSASEEHRLLAMDHYVAPKPADNHQAHLLEHNYALLVLELAEGGNPDEQAAQGWDTQAILGAMRAQGNPPGLENWAFEPGVLRAGLERHIQEHEEAVEKQLAEQEAAMQAQMAQVGAAGGDPRLGGEVAMIQNMAPAAPTPAGMEASAGL